MYAILFALSLLGIGAFYMKPEDTINIFTPTTQEEKDFVRYDSLYKLSGAKYNINWRWLKAIAYVESDNGKNIRVQLGQTSYDGLSYGLMQIAEGIGSPKEISLKGFGGKEALNDPAYSIDIGAKLLSYLFNKYKDTEKAFRAYNQGEKNTDNNKDYTLNYSKKVFDKLDYIKRMEASYGIFN